MGKRNLVVILVLTLVVAFTGCKKDNSAANTYALNVSATNGTVIRNPDQSTYIEGTTVQLTAMPGSGYKFASWSGDATGSANTITVTVTSNKNITANFTSLTGLVVDAKSKGAKGDGVTDDTAALQAAVDQVAGTGGIAFVPDGTYLINPAKHLNLKSNMTLSLSAGALLKAIPVSTDGSAVVQLNNIQDVTITGGTIEGERNGHTGAAVSGDGHGHGINIQGAANIVVKDLTAKNCWGDGIYVGKGTTVETKNVIIDHVISDNNRRQGLSVVMGDGIVIRNSVFKNTNGTAPQAGIDLEPNVGFAVRNVQILNCQVLNNTGTGIILWVDPTFTNTILDNVTVDGNTVADNGLETPQGIAMVCRTAQKITNNIIRNNYKYGISFEGTSGGFITGNIISNTRTDAGAGVGGIYFRPGTAARPAATNYAVTGNTITGHTQNMRVGDASNIVHPNTVGTISLSAAAYTVAENVASKTATVTVTRIGSGPGYGAATVKYATSNGTATAGSDYTATSGTISWADGDVADKTFTVTITNDTLTEGPETVNITLSDLVGALAGANKSAVLTITE
ncbi:MAG: Calx-beta domain-containing protein [Prolixibacteraceae bacterium]|jgi:parallel beta-helix repeat protein